MQNTLEIVSTVNNHTHTKNASKKGNNPDQRFYDHFMHDMNLELKRYPGELSAHDMSELAVKAQHNAKAKDEVLTRNLPLILKCAKNHPVAKFLNVEDLVNEGYIALEAAIQGYKPGNGEFVSYAKRIIDCMLLVYAHENGSLIRLKDHSRKLLAKAHKVADLLEQKLGRTPKFSEIAEAMHLDPSHLGYKTLCFLMMTHLSPSDMSSIEIDGCTHLNGEWMDPSKNIDSDEAAVNDARELANHLVGTLTGNKRKVIEMIFGLGPCLIEYTLSDIALDMGVTPQRVGQIRDDAIYDMRLAA